MKTFEVVTEAAEMSVSLSQDEYDKEAIVLTAAFDNDRPLYYNFVVTYMFLLYT